MNNGNIYGTRSMQKLAGASVSVTNNIQGDDWMKASITLNNAQIKTVVTPYVIIPATETLNYSGVPTQIPLPLSVIIRIDNGAGGYINVDGAAQFVIALGSDWSMNFMNVRAGGLDSASGCRIYIPEYLYDYTNGVPTPAEGVSHFHNISTVGGLDFDGGLQDNALAIVLDNLSAGDLTGGDDANSLTVTVLYDIIDL